jgi:hypothetical protein
MSLRAANPCKISQARQVDSVGSPPVIQRGISSYTMANKCELPTAAFDVQGFSQP